MNRNGIVRTFYVEYQEGRYRKFWHESLTFALANAIARKLAIEGCKPVVRRLDIPTAELHGLLVRFEFIRADSIARSL